MLKNNINIENENSVQSELASVEKEKEAKPKKKIVKPLLIGFFAIFLVSVIVWLATPSESTGTSTYSENQERVIANFGKPQTFKIAMQDGQRLEYWRYIYLDEVFVFQDGEFIARQHFNFDVNDSQGIHINLEPSNFYQLQRIEQVDVLLDTKPTLEAEIDSQILGPDFKFYSYGQLLNLTTQQEQIIVVDSVALKKGTDATKIDVGSVSDDNLGTKDVVEKKGKIFIGNSDQSKASFSYYLDDPSYRYIKQRKLITDGEEQTVVYGYCYTMDEGASFSDEPQDPYACADNESMLWTISIYDLKTYESLDEMTKAYEEELHKSNEHIFTISHANGDFPKEVPIWSEILVDIKNDFSVPAAKEYMQMIGE